MMILSVFSLALLCSVWQSSAPRLRWRIDRIILFLFIKFKATSSSRESYPHSTFPAYGYDIDNLSYFFEIFILLCYTINTYTLKKIVSVRSALVPRLHIHSPLLLAPPPRRFPLPLRLFVPRADPPRQVTFRRLKFAIFRDILATHQRPHFRQ